MTATAAIQFFTLQEKEAITGIEWDILATLCSVPTRNAAAVYAELESDSPYLAQLLEKRQGMEIRRNFHTSRKSKVQLYGEAWRKHDSKWRELETSLRDVNSEIHRIIEKRQTLRSQLARDNAVLASVNENGQEVIMPFWDALDIEHKRAQGEEL